MDQGRQIERFLTLTEVERLTGITANSLRIRKNRGKPMPFPVYEVEGFGLAVRPSELKAWNDKLKPVAPVEAA